MRPPPFGPNRLCRRRPAYNNAYPIFLLIVDVRSRVPDLAACCRPTAGTMAKLAALMDESEHDVLAYMTFPAQYRRPPLCRYKYQ